MTFPFPTFFPGGNDFPKIIATLDGGVVAPGTGNWNLPSGIQNGSLVVIHVRGTNNDFTVPAGWQTGYKALSPIGPNFVTGAVIWRRCNGTEGSTLAVTVTGSGGGLRAQSLLISGAASLEFASVTNTGAASTIPDPPNLSPSFGSRKTLWLACFAAGTAMSGYPPTNYTNQLLAANTAMAVASRNLQAASENPPSVTQVSADWVCGTVAIRP